MSSNAPDMLTKKQAAEFLQCSEKALDNFVKEGILTRAIRRYGRLVRFYRPELIEAGRLIPHGEDKADVSQEAR